MTRMPYRSVAVVTLVGRGFLLLAAALAVRVGTIGAAADFLFAMSLARLATPALSVGSLQVPVTARVKSVANGANAVSAACGVGVALLMASSILCFLLGGLVDWRVGFIAVLVGSTASRAAAVGALRGANWLVVATLANGLVFPSALLVVLALPLLAGRTDLGSADLLGLAATASVVSTLVAIALATVASTDRPRISVPGRWYLMAGLGFVGLGLGSLASGQMFAVFGRYLVDASAYTTFALAVRAGAVIAMPLEVVSGLVPTKIADAAAAHELASIQGSLRRVATAATLAGVVLLVPVGAVYWLSLTPELRDASAVPLIVIISAGQLINVWSGNCTMLLSFSGYRRSAIVAVWSAVAIGAATGLALGSILGVYGLAIGAAVTVATNNGLCLIAGHRELAMTTTASLKEVRSVTSWLMTNMAPRVRHA